MSSSVTASASASASRLVRSRVSRSLRAFLVASMANWENNLGRESQTMTPFVNSDVISNNVTSLVML